MANDDKTNTDHHLVCTLGFQVKLPVAMDQIDPCLITAWLKLDNVQQLLNYINVKVATFDWLFGGGDVLKSLATRKYRIQN